MGFSDLFVKKKKKFSLSIKIISYKLTIKISSHSAISMIKPETSPSLQVFGNNIHFQEVKKNFYFENNKIEGKHIGWKDSIFHFQTHFSFKRIL